MEDTLINICGFEESLSLSDDVQLAISENNSVISISSTDENCNPETNEIVESSCINLKNLHSPVETRNILLNFLRENFKFNDFWPLQLECITTLLSGKHCFLVTAAGSGKSLIYQVAAAATNGVTVVIIPTLSLIKDQIDKLNKIGFSAECLTAETSREKRAFIYRELSQTDPVIKLLYMTPEMFSSESNAFDTIIDRLQNNMALSRLVIEEASVIYLWCNTCRPIMKKLNTLKIRFPNVPILLISSSTPSNKRPALIKFMNMNKTKLFYSPSDVRTSEYQVFKITEERRANTILNFVQMKFKNLIGIIFCRTKVDCQQLTNILKNNSVKAVSYFPALTSLQKIKAQDSWFRNEVHVIVATDSFGIGIHKKEIDFVIHSYIPDSLEMYFQQCGRAANQNKYSLCVLFYSSIEICHQKSTIRRNNINNGDLMKKQLFLFDQMCHYCEEIISCWRKKLAKYFDVDFASTLITNDCRCDNCMKKIKSNKIDITKYSKMISTLIYEIGSDNFKITRTYLVSLFRGKNEDKNLIHQAHRKHPFFGKGKNLSREMIGKIIGKLFNYNYIKETKISYENISFTYLRLTKHGKDIIFGNKNIAIFL